MSKIGRIPVQIKEGVTVTIESGEVKAVGSKGTLTFRIPGGINVQIAENVLNVSQKKENDSETKALFGLTRAMIANIITGVSTGFEKKLELSGVGYRAQASGGNLTLSVGFSHPVIFKAPEGITFTVADNVITVSGIDKVLVGDMAAKIRAVRPPEPYKGKGIKYEGERIRRKAGKAAKAVGK
ncbi:50S ribosomal protein L6 [Patescibacteria group bacterium]|nr:50S ribosomal protein L6 [Patescibacteria group bacterium]